MYIITFTVFCLCTYLYCFVVILLFCVIFMFSSCFVVLCIFIFVCTSVGLLPPGESPIAVSNNNNNLLTHHHNHHCHQCCGAWWALSSFSFCNNVYSAVILAPRPTPKMEDQGIPF
jgi:hypothetical protein